MFEKQHENDTYLERLGAAKQNHFKSLMTIIVVTIAIVFGLLYANFKAMGLATGAEGGMIWHGLGYTFLQPFYTLWAIYYVLVGHKP